MHVAAGAFHSGAVDADGNAYMWGRGDGWQLGTGLKHHECYPQQVRQAGGWGGGAADWMAATQCGARRGQQAGRLWRGAAAAGGGARAALLGIT